MKYKGLLLEDNRLYRLALIAQLEKIACAVDTVETIEAANSRLIEQRYDFILTNTRFRRTERSIALNTMNQSIPIIVQLNRVQRYFPSHANYSQGIYVLGKPLKNEDYASILKIIKKHTRYITIMEKSDNRLPLLLRDKLLRPTIAAAIVELYDMLEQLKVAYHYKDWLEVKYIAYELINLTAFFLPELNQLAARLQFLASTPKSEKISIFNTHKQLRETAAILINTVCRRGLNA